MVLSADVDNDVQTEEQYLVLEVRIWHDGGINFESSSVRSDLEDYLRAEMRDEFNVVLNGQPCMVELIDVEVVD